MISSGEKIGLFCRLCAVCTIALSDVIDRLILQQQVLCYGGELLNTDQLINGLELINME